MIVIAVEKHFDFKKFNYDTVNTSVRAEKNWELQETKKEMKRASETRVRRNNSYENVMLNWALIK